MLKETEMKLLLIQMTETKLTVRDPRAWTVLHSLLNTIQKARGERSARRMPQKVLKMMKTALKV